MIQGRFSVFPHENFVDLFLVQFGWEQCIPLHSYGPHIRNNYLFHYVISGRGWLDVRQRDGTGKRYQLHAGQGFLICPNQVTTYCADENDPWAYAWVEFGGVQSQYRLTLAGLGEDQPIYTTIQPEMANKVKDELLYIANHAQDSSLSLMAHFYLFLDALINSSSSKQRVRGLSQQGFYIREAIHFIDQYYRSDIRIEQVAGFCGLNRTYFSRLFKEVMGQTPQEYLARYRITKAMELMRNTDMSIGEIASMVGYHNQLYFSKVFRKFQGLPPRVWRQEDMLKLEKSREESAQEGREK
ncbi:AraC family transcriptional regulator [Pseudoflavonifractor phocaeensis]|uniref:AraC family transcriptional regulator n=1 Tax=Pseudoflavonifractor phocaeensis TaxID=1870988 RepID=UPI0019581FD7|nr:AraC family transcriptional regulator [Pseudoflavonifractor phocaeensis]MBM6870955.1 AraC family transcriptional regulator [Pseudoflavonifractor phocaeensis]MBM6938310.1 AraC family transcriptional regulator [Pseudoflavonifractor phocaeensis]